MSFRMPEESVARPRKSLPRRVANKLLALVLLAAAVGLVALIVAIAVTYTGGPDVKPGQKVTVTIPKDATSKQVAHVLHEKGVIRSEVAFRARLRLSGDSTKIHAGTFTLTTLSGYHSVMNQLEKAPPAAPVFTITFPEGFRIADMEHRIDRDHGKTASQGIALPRFTGRQYLAATHRAVVPAKYQPPKGTKSLEGFLFPATYELRNSDGPAALVAKQLDAFSQTMDGIDLSYAKSKHLTPYEVVIIASMIEREAKAADERAKVSEVIYNRLHARMTLGIDATIQYVVDPDVWRAELRQSDLDIQSPFNTRLRVGLPPTPIANPGKASLEAAAHPATGKLLYYVALKDDSGRHYFTDSYSDFTAHS